MYKDVVLISLVNVFYRVRYFNEVVIVVYVVLDVFKELNVNYFILGNIYVVSIKYV